MTLSLLQKQKKLCAVLIGISETTSLPAEGPHVHVRNRHFVEIVFITQVTIENDFGWKILSFEYFLDPKLYR